MSSIILKKNFDLLMEIFHLVVKNGDHLKCKLRKMSNYEAEYFLATKCSTDFKLDAKHLINVYNIYYLQGLRYSRYTTYML